MNILLIHGDNQVASRDRLQELKIEEKEKGVEVISFAGRDLCLTLLIQALEAQSLFAQAKLVVIEDLVTSTKTNSQLWEYLKTSEFSANLVLWEGKKIDGRKLGWIKTKKGCKIEEFSYPAVLFKFLDSVSSPLKSQTLRLFAQALQTQPVELVYYMLVRHFRLLLLVRAKATHATIKDTRNLQGWQIKKLTAQAAKRTLAELISIYKKLMYIDYQQKTGQAALDLKQTLDIFLATL